MSIRGISPYNMSSPDYSTQYQKLSQYQSLGILAQNLINLLYPNFNDYLQGLTNPLEDYIVAFDKNLNDDGAITSLGSRIGIFIPIDRSYRPYEIFIDKIVEYINTINKLSPDNPTLQLIGYDPLPSTQQIINMDIHTFKNQYIKYIIDYKDYDLDQLYQDRLMVFTEIIKSNV